MPKRRQLRKLIFTNELNYKMPIGIEHRKNSGKRNRDSTNDKLATVMNTKLHGKKTEANRIATTRLTKN